MKSTFLSLFAPVCLLLALSCPDARADEGMWMISHLSAHTDSVLHSMGLEIPLEQLYNETGAPCLNKAILQFDGGCSASVVSPLGLVFTNHHCGYEAIQQHSTPRHDYLTHGFYAKTFKKELPNEDMYVLFHLKTVDVTERILSEVPDTADWGRRTEIIDSIAMRLTDEADDPDNFIEAEVNPYFGGSRYYLSLYERYNDVRLVYAPPSCLGKYGGETDNWMWPRQTCDFSVFRVYATPDGRPANYSKKNVPLHTDNYVRISTQGYRDGSYCMTLGYPGGTERYLSSYGIESMMKNYNAVMYDARTQLLSVIREAQRSSDALRIMYATKYAHCANYWKFSLGQNQALENLGVVAEKRALESQLTQWIARDSLGRSRYVGVLDSLRTLYAGLADRTKALTLWQECLYSSSDILGFIFRNVMSVLGSGTKHSFRESVERAYKDIDIPTDRQLLKTMLAYYISECPDSAYLPRQTMARIDSVFGGSIDAFVDDLYSRSVYANPKRLAKVKHFSDTTDDPMVETAFDLFFISINSAQENHVEDYERLLGDAIREMNHEREYYPDANFTLRLSYGLCRPIDPGLLAAAKAKSRGQNGMIGQTSLDAASLVAESDRLCTTPASFLAKHDKNPGERDFSLTPPVLQWMRSGHVSERYLDPATGQLPLCFLTTNDITGGNSGSGMYDGKGRLIGLAFDGNWEAMSGDIKFDPNLQRCIGVDIRWVLSVIDDYSHADRLIRELTIE